MLWELLVLMLPGMRLVQLVLLEMIRELLLEMIQELMLEIMLGLLVLLGMLVEVVLLVQLLMEMFLELLREELLVVLLLMEMLVVLLLRMLLPGGNDEVPPFAAVLLVKPVRRESDAHSTRPEKRKVRGVLRFRVQGPTTKGKVVQIGPLLSMVIPPLCHLPLPGLILIK